MVNKFKKIIAIIVALVCALSVITVPAFADEATLKCDSNVFLGDTFTVKVDIKCNSVHGLGSVDALLTYDESVFECVSYPSGNSKYDAEEKGYKLVYWAQQGDIPSTSFTYKFKAIKEGSGGIAITATIYDWDEQLTATKENSVRVYVSDKTKLSGNADLKTLMISSGTLSPAFNKDVTSYDIKIGNSVTELLIQADTVEKGAQISVDGSSSMKIGKNVRKIIVTAPNGDVKTYTLNITRAQAGEDVSSEVSSDTSSTDKKEETNPYEISVAGEQKYVLKDFSGLSIPTGFKETNVTINGAEVPAVVDPVNAKTLVYATDKDGSNGAFYIFDRDKDKFQIYRHFLTSSLPFVILDYEESNFVPEGYISATAQIGGFTCNGYKYTDANYSDYIVLYCETADGTGFYRYDMKEGSLQRFPEFGKLMEDKGWINTNKSIAEKFADMNLKSKIIIISGLVLILLIIALIVILIVRNIKARKREIEEEMKSIQLLDGVDGREELYLGDIEEKDTAEEIDFNNF